MNVPVAVSRRLKDGSLEVTRLVARLEWKAAKELAKLRARYGPPAPPPRWTWDQLWSMRRKP